MFRHRLTLVTATVLLTACWPRHRDPSAGPEEGAKTSAVVTLDAVAGRTILDAPAPTAVALQTEAEAEALPLEEVEVVDEPAAAGSWRTAGFVTVRAEPRHDAEALGLLAPKTRLAKRPLKKDRTCRTGWLEVEPRGFICGKLTATRDAPSDVMLPRLAKGALVPGVFGQVRKSAKIYASVDAVKAGHGEASEASLTVQKIGSARVDGTSYWRTRHGLVAAASVRQFRGSRFHGVELGEDVTLPIGWTLREKERFSAPVYAEPMVTKKAAARVKPRQVFGVEEISGDGAFAKLEGQGWIPRGLVRVATKADPPEGLREGERWVDIDLDQQTLVAYEGETPVYATMISSGKANHGTPTGVYRIHRKVAQRTMNSMADSTSEYSVDKVPWTAYFAHGYALHAAYWHGAFGRKKSHGCVNLAPIDAKRLYAWTAPLVAPGWLEVYGHEGQLGSVVRIRSKKDPNPSWQGYGKKIAMADVADDDHIEST